MLLLPSILCLIKILIFSTINNVKGISQRRPLFDLSFCNAQGFYSTIEYIRKGPSVLILYICMCKKYWLI